MDAYANAVFSGASADGNLTFQHVHVDAGLTGVGRCAGVVATVPGRRIPDRQDAGGELAARYGHSVVLVVVHHPVLVVPARGAVVNVVL